MPYVPATSACMHNSMTTKPTQVGPYRVPAGVIVFPCLFSILNYSGNWNRPQQVQAGARQLRL